jgi:hypothetical protein
VAAFSNTCVVCTDRLGEGSGGHEDLNFSNPGGSISGEAGSVSVGEENGGIDLHADDAPGSTEVTVIASVSAASGKACAMSARGRRGEGGCELSYPGSILGQGGRGCCCGSNPSGPLFGGGLGGDGAVGRRFAFIDSSAPGSREASSGTVAAES